MISVVLWSGIGLVLVGAIAALVRLCFTL